MFPLFGILCREKSGNPGVSEQQGTKANGEIGSQFCIKFGMCKKGNRLFFEQRRRVKKS
jgi:hypothetical protein